MSCDWNIRCVDCESTHRFLDANHLEQEMWAIIDQAAAIAALAPLMSDTRIRVGISLRLGDHGGHGYGSINPKWFAEHLGHKLVPTDEYGILSGQCSRLVRCETCKTEMRCRRKFDHEGPCDPLHGKKAEVP